MALATYPGVQRNGPPLLPYLVLLRVGFAMPAKLLPPRCALTAPFHPYRKEPKNSLSGGIFSVALSVRPFRTCPAVSRHVALWRPDFPPLSSGAKRLPTGATARPTASLSFSHGLVVPEVAPYCAAQHPVDEGQWRKTCPYRA